MTFKVKANSAVIDTYMATTCKTDPSTTTGLTFGYTAGLTSDDDTSSIIAAGTLTLVDNDTNYVYVNQGSIAVATTLPGTISDLCYIVTTASGAITDIEDTRGIA